MWQGSAETVCGTAPDRTAIHALPLTQGGTGATLRALSPVRDEHSYTDRDSHPEGDSPRAMLKPATIDIWSVDARDGGWDRWAGTLDGRERWRAAELRKPDAYHRFVRTRAALRSVLAGYLGGSAAEVPIGYGRFGKPELVGGRLQFNVSHSGPRALIAVSHAPVGIDLERVESECGALRWLEAAILHPLEHAVLGSLEAATRVRAFYQTWVQKESYVKMLGVGLVKHLAHCRVISAAAGSEAFVADAHEEGGRPSRNRLLDVTIADAYAASVCTPLESARLVMRTARPGRA